MFLGKKKETALWGHLILWIFIVTLIFPRLGLAVDTSNEYVTIPNDLTDLLTVDQLYESSSSKGFQVDSAHPCFSAIDGVLFSKDQKTLIRFPYRRDNNEYAIPNGTITIDDDAFLFTECLHKITLPATVKNCLGALQSGSVSINDIEVISGNQLYSSVEGVLYSKDHKKMLCYPRGRTKAHFSIAEGTEVIGDNAFLYCHNLTSISMPDTVYTIADSAFCGMNDLKMVELSNGLKTIEYAAFATSSNLQEITLPEGLVCIGEGAFLQTRLTSIHIPKTVNYIGHGAFEACDLLEAVYFENKSVSIEDDAFSHFFDLGAEETFGWNGKPIELTMYVYYGSTAEMYAMKNGFSMKYIN